MHWGTEFLGGADYTTPTAQLEAIATADPINLAWDKICEIDQTISCTGDVDCPVGQDCVPMPPTLSFKHQVSLIDHRAH